MKSDYGPNYWKLDGIKGLLFGLCQKRRGDWVKKYLRRGTVLDVGCGGNKTRLGISFEVNGIDPLYGGEGVTKVDYLQFKPKEKFGAVMFWESLEHEADTESYLKKSFELLNDGGVVLIEYPDWGSWESRFFGRRWYHEDLPRHKVRLTKKMVERIALEVGFEKCESRNILAPEYSIWGLVASIYGGGRRLEQDLNWWRVILIGPLVLLATVLELPKWVMGQSPIALYVGKKV